MDGFTTSIIRKSVIVVNKSGKATQTLGLVGNHEFCHPKVGMQAQLRIVTFIYRLYTQLVKALFQCWG